MILSSSVPPSSSSSADDDRRGGRNPAGGGPPPSTIRVVEHRHGGLGDCDGDDNGGGPGAPHRPLHAPPPPPPTTMDGGGRHFDRQDDDGGGSRLPRPPSYPQHHEQQHGDDEEVRFYGDQWARRQRQTGEPGPHRRHDGGGGGTVAGPRPPSHPQHHLAMQQQGQGQRRRHDENYDEEVRFYGDQRGRQPGEPDSHRRHDVGAAAGPRAPTPLQSNVRRRPPTAGDGSSSVGSSYNGGRGGGYDDGGNVGGVPTPAVLFHPPLQRPQPQRRQQHLVLEARGGATAPGLSVTAPASEAGTRTSSSSSTSTAAARSLWANRHGRRRASPTGGSSGPFGGGGGGGGTEVTYHGQHELGGGGASVSSLENHAPRSEVSIASTSHLRSASFLAGRTLRKVFGGGGPQQGGGGGEDAAAHYPHQQRLPPLRAVDRGPGDPSAGGEVPDDPGTPTAATASERSAASFARGAPMAGYLEKLGSNIPTFKRRFFVLKPTTHLYYFVSPHDSVPRGCIDLEGGDVDGEGEGGGGGGGGGAVEVCDDVEVLPDGRCRFELILGGGVGGEGGGDSDGAASTGGGEGGATPAGGGVDMSNDDSLPPPSPSTTTAAEDEHPKRRRRKIVLEARSEGAAREWMDALRTERLSHVRAEREDLLRRELGLEEDVRRLTGRVEELRLAEEDRDGALRDAEAWRGRFDGLDEAVRLLTRAVLRRDGGGDVDVNGGVGGKEDLEAVVPNEEAGGGPADTDDGPAGDDGGVEDEAATCRGEDGAESSAEADDGRSAASSSGRGPRGGGSLGSSVFAAPDDASSSAAGASGRVDEPDPENDAKGEDHASSILGPEERLLDRMDLSGTNFSALYNACHMLRQNLAMTSKEASAAEDDARESAKRAEALRSRMTKAERMIARLWEENCDLRKTVKRQKEERRVLVREVRSLLASDRARAQAETAPGGDEATVFTGGGGGRDHASVASAATAAAAGRGAATATDHDGMHRHPLFGSTEKRLIVELEEDIVSSLRLHQQFLAAGRSVGGGSEPRPPSSSSCGDGANQGVVAEELETIRTKSSLLVNDDDESSDDDSDGDGSRSPIKPRILLLDRHLNDGGSDVSSIAPSSCAGAAVVPTVDRGSDPIVPGGEMSQGGDDGPSSATEDDADAAPDRPLPRPQQRSQSLVTVESAGGDRHPAIRSLDEECQDAETAKSHHRRCSSTASLSSRSQSVITDNGRATSRLECPISGGEGGTGAGGGGTVNLHGEAVQPSPPGEDGRVYHLTFHSRKIGIQFQRVPAPSTPHGKLTEAMAIETGGSSRGNDTADELRTVARLSRRAAGRGDAHNDDDGRGDGAEYSCEVATPVDAVLVCGFHGFDDACNHRRPKLGARLVAFDGISVEVGRWTFESVRKAIQARGRPLSLSFRNDYLNREQRSIMARAVADVAAAPPVAPLGSQHPGDHVTSRHDAATAGGAMSPICEGGRPPGERDREALRDVGLNSADLERLNEAYSTPPSGKGRRGRRGENLRSFSEAGASSIISSTVTPLVANLLSGLARGETRSETIPPPYLSEESRSSLDDMSHHHDFKASLL